MTFGFIQLEHKILGLVLFWDFWVCLSNEGEGTWLLPLQKFLDNVGLPLSLNIMLKSPNLEFLPFCRAQVQVQVRSRSGEGQEGQKLT